MKKLFKKKMAAGGPVGKPKPKPKKEEGYVDTGIDPAILNKYLVDKKGGDVNQMMREVGESDRRRQAEFQKQRAAPKKMGGKVAKVAKKIIAKKKK